VILVARAANDKSDQKLFPWEVDKALLVDILDKKRTATIMHALAIFLSSSRGVR
jgi:hypothetical protein